MTRQHDHDPATPLDRVLGRWMHDDAPPAAPDRLIDGLVERAEATPQRSGRGRATTLLGGALLATAAAVLVAIALGAPGLFGDRLGAIPSPTPVASESPAEPTPTSSPAVPSEQPSPSPVASPTPVGEPASGEPVLALTTVCDVTPPVVLPQVSVVADGRVAWQPADPERLTNGYTVRRLTPEGLDALRDRIEATGLFAADATYGAEPLPNSEPPGMGACAHEYSYVDADGDTVTIESIGWFGDEFEAEYFVPSPARRTLDELATALRDIEATMGDAAWADDAQPYEPETWVVAMAETVREAATLGAPDVAELTWPAGEGPPGDFGDPVENGSGVFRCGIVDADALDATLQQLVESGLTQFATPLVAASATLPWQERDAALDLWVWPVLPPMQPGCDALQ